MKTRIKQLNQAIQHLDSDTRDNQLLPKLSVDDPFYGVFESVNRLSEKVKESNKWFHKFERIFKINELKEIDEYDKDNSLENQLIHTSKMAQIGLMATEITHEMTHPLTYLKNYLYTLSDDLTTDDSTLNNKLRNNLEIATKEVNRLINLVNHIQEFSRKDIDQNRISIKFSEVINHTLLLMDDQIQSSNIRLIKNIQKDLPHVTVNPNDIEQVLINLLQNAIDSLKEIENNAVLEIVIYQKKEQKKFCIEINDNGKGVDEHIKNKIFTPFFTTKPAGEGTGLGLNIIQRIIEKYEGTIKCKSSDGKGASFVISLPI